MQLKKMTDVLPTLYASQVKKGHVSLTTSPKQASVGKVNLIKANDENYNSGYRKTDQTKLYQPHCIRCRSVQEILILELQKQKCQRSEDDQYICHKCKTSTSSPIGFGTKAAKAAPENRKRLFPIKPLRTFRLKNFHPDKYYCDKCRFSTKDPLQHKKHISQHEEIKFICSYCNSVSYTKGEFQRHLVKHTGKFPFQCKYCEYGAVRHDYIVKHTQRLHSGITGQQVMPSTEQKSHYSPKLKQGWKRLARDVPLQNRPSRSSSIQDEINGTVSLTEAAKYSQGAAYIQGKNGHQSSNTNLCKNGNSVIEVELCSPKKGPLTPEMPLIVVAPAKFLVPPNCLAQIVELKTVNDIQQLILELIPLNEASFPSMNYKEGESGNRAELGGKTINTGVLSNFEADAMKKKHRRNLDSPGSSGSAPPNCSTIKAQEEKVASKESVGKEYLHAPLVAENSFEKRDHPKSFQKGKCYKNEHISGNLNASTCLRFPSDDRSQNGVLDIHEDNVSLPSPSALDAIALTVRNAENERRVTRKRHSFDSDSLHTLESDKELKQDQPAISDTYVESSETQNVDHGDLLDGPVISSVFSLSSGALNIPGGVTWNDSLQRKSSKSTLYKRIAELMSAVDSNVRFKSTASLRHEKDQDSKEKVLSVEGPCGRRRSTTAVEEKLAPSSEGPKELSDQQEWPPEMLTKSLSKVGVTNKMQDASPIFIPQGTVLRVLNCTSAEDSTEKENGNEKLPFPPTYCNKTFLPRPVPCCVSAKFLKGLSLSTGSEMNGAPQSQMLSQRPRTERVPVGKANSQQNRRWPFPKDAEPYGETKGLKKGKEHQNKNEHGSGRGALLNKRSRIQGGCFLKVLPMLMKRLRLIPFTNHQLMKGPQRNQPVVVLNHPDVDSPEVINIMKMIHKYKNNVLKAVLSERTISCLGVKRHHKRLTCQNFGGSTLTNEQCALKMKLKKTDENNLKVVTTSLAEASKQMFQCWFCGRMYIDQEEWMSHGQKHLVEATRGWNAPSFSEEGEK